MSIVHTKFSHMSNHELTRLVSSSDCTQLEIELAARLDDVLNEVREIAASTLRLPPLNEQLTLADCA